MSIGISEEHAELARSGDGLRARPDVELAVDGVGLRLDGVRRDEGALGDLVHARAGEPVLGELRRGDLEDLGLRALAVAPALLDRGGLGTRRGSPGG